jgi:uncharacterized protein involved in type VI secretion and phage assembly
MTDFVSSISTALSAQSAAGGAEGAAGSLAGAAGGASSSDANLLAVALEVEINGPLSPDIAAKIAKVDVESHLNLPDSMVVTFWDPDRSVISDGGFILGSTMKVSADLTSDAEGDTTELAEGEITALEMQQDHDGCFTIVRGLDKSNELFRGTKTMAYQEMTASDVVEQIAGDASLTPMSDPTDATYTVLTQANQSDWEFIQQLARESNRWAFASQGTLYFIKPVTTDLAPPAADGTTPPIPGQLLLGTNLMRISTSITAAEQVSSIEVRGWDPSQKAAIVGEGEAGTSSMSNDDSPDEIAGTFGGKTYVYTDIPYSDQSQADATASAIAERLGSSYVDIDGEAIGSSWLMAGIPVSIAGSGDPFDGSYVVTSARHLIDSQHGYRTEFTVSGIRDTTFAGLTNSEWQKQKRHLIPGVVTATVSSVKDPTSSGLVQLSFPWLDDDYVSDWCRVLQVGAGSSWGNILLPEVNSEVLVAFEQGDPRKPYVIGGLYNGQDTIAPQSDTQLVDDGTGAINQRLYQSRTKHLLYFNDSASAGCVLLQSGDTNHMLKFDQSGSGTITLQSNGDITIQGNNVTITAQQNLQMQGQSQLSMSSPQITVSADSTLAITSNGTASLTASATLSLSGSMTSINS